MKMTLKEKVMEMQPSCVGDVYGGGVHGCPANYPYLNKIQVRNPLPPRSREGLVPSY